MENLKHAKLDNYLEGKGIDYSLAAKAIGVSKKHFIKCLNWGESFTVKQVETFCEKFNISMDLFYYKC